VSEVESTYASRRVILEQPYPNPLSSETTIEYGLPEATRVSLKVYNLLGQEVRTLVNEPKDAGIHTMTWDGRDDSGRRVPSGTYFLRLKVGQHAATRKLCVVR
jgi:flagellar hook assembly protein FlgD